MVIRPVSEVNAALEAFEAAEAGDVWVDRAQFAAATSVAAMAVPGSLLNDGMSHQGMWLTATTGGLELSTRGPDLSVRTHVAATVDPAGHVGGSAGVRGQSVIVPARLLARLTPRLEPGPVALGLGPGGLVVRSGRFRGRFHALEPTDQHPPLPDVVAIWEATVPGGVFRGAVDHISGAIGPVVSRPLGSGWFLIAPDGRSAVDLAVTDRFDLAVATCPVESIKGSGPIGAVSLPISTVAVLRAARHGSGPAVIRVGVDRVAITVGSTTIAARRSLEPVPDHRLLTRIEPTHWMSVSRRNLAPVMRRIRILARDHHRAVWFELARDLAVARSSHSELGQASDPFPVRFTGPPCEIGVGLHRLAEMTSRLPDGPVRVEFAASDKVACLLSEDRPDLRFYTRLLAVRHRPWRSATDHRRDTEPPLLPPDRLDVDRETGDGQD